MESAAKRRDEILGNGTKEISGPVGATEMCFLQRTPASMRTSPFDIKG